MDIKSDRPDVADLLLLFDQLQNVRSTASIIADPMSPGRAPYVAFVQSIDAAMSYVKGDIEDATRHG